MRRLKRAWLRKISRRQADRYLLRFVRGSFRVLRAFPLSVSARWAERIFLTPPRQRRSRSEREFLARARFRRVVVGRRSIATWHWGQGPAVLLVHGWGGHAARLARFVAPLEGAGFSVISFDAPAHLRSGGKLCDLSDFVRAIKTVARASARRGSPVVAVIGHSLGASACALAMKKGAMKKGLSIQAGVFLAPISNCEEYTRRFATLCRIPGDVHESMKIRLARRQRVSWKKLRLASLPGSGVPLLIFHDRGDLKVPPRHGRAFADTWPGTDLVTTRGLGHHKILRDPEVIARSVSFLQRSFIVPIEETPVPMRASLRIA